MKKSVKIIRFDLQSTNCAFVQFKNLSGQMDFFLTWTGREAVTFANKFHEIPIFSVFKALLLELSPLACLFTQPR